jgi:predicted dehydrogenase
MESLSWLLIGAGDIARNRVAPALTESAICRLEGICSRTAEGARKLAVDFGIEKCFETVEEALNESSAQAVYIASPVGSHVPLARAALRAGKHVLIEKPLGLHASECIPLLQEAEERKLLAGCAYYRRCSARYAHLCQAVASGILGSLICVRMQYASWYCPEGLAPWRTQTACAAGGPLGDMGSHMFDVILGALGKPRILSARMYHHVQSYAAEDGAAVLGELPGNVPVLANFHWSSRTWLHELEITGSDASLIWAPFDSGPVTVAAGRDRQTLDLPPAHNVHLPLIEDFVHAVRDGRPPVCPASEAIKTNVLLDEIYLASVESAGNQA